jgi:ornithine carbamoyltransferase
MTQLGGHAIYLQPNDIQLGKRESIADAARTMDRMVQGIMARVFAHSTVVELAKNSSVPVINGLSDLEHPCQALADFLTIKEKKGSLKGLKVAYIGDGNNVTHSLMLLAAKTGVDFWAATPEGYEPKEEVVAAAREDAKASHAQIHLTDDPIEAARDADVVYTDTWISMGDEAQAEERKKIFPPYQINSRLMKAAKPDAIVLHCLPAYRGLEITDEVIDSPQSVVFDEAENRLHVQKAIMAMTM